MGLTFGMAASYGVDGITVNAVCPGLFESEMTEDTLFKNEEFMRMYNFTDPMSRPGRRGELNGTILYFSSDASSYVTGQHVVVDGGASIVEGRSVLWRADFRHDHINGEACREGGVKMRFLPDVALRVTRNTLPIPAGCFSFGPNRSGAGPSGCCNLGEPMPVPEVRLSRYCLVGSG